MSHGFELSNPMGLLNKLHSKITMFGTPRFDKHRIHRSWNYNPNNKRERNAIKKFAEYTKEHGVPQRSVNVWTKDGRIYYNIRSFMFDPVHTRFTHYLAYPNWAKSNNSSESTYWSISFQNAVELDPEYHQRCVFYNTGTCNYCNTVNENEIG